MTKSPEYTAAMDALKKAKADYETASKPVLDKVHASPEYVEAKHDYDSADARLASLKSSGNATDVTAMTTVNNDKGAAKQKMERLDNEALAADTNVQAAKKGIADAEAKIAEQNKHLDELVAADQPCTDAKTALDDAVKKVADAKLNLQNAIKQNQEEAKNHGSSSGGSSKGGGGAMGGGGKGSGGGYK
jgi:chromosome segregation ATPase